MGSETMDPQQLTFQVLLAVSLVKCWAVFSVSIFVTSAVVCHAAVTQWARQIRARYIFGHKVCLGRNGDMDLCVSCSRELHLVFHQYLCISRRNLNMHCSHDTPSVIQIPHDKPHRPLIEIILPVPFDQLKIYRFYFGILGWSIDFCYMCKVCAVIKQMSHTSKYQMNLHQ